MASNTEQETRLCGNCKRDIPAINFTIHDIHCHRNIRICKLCKEPVPSIDMDEHMTSEHMPVTCKCKMTMEKNLLEEHERSSCPLRLIICQFCELELPCNKLGDHEEYCGARTERCEKCGSSVMAKDLKDHPDVCGKVIEPKKPARAQRNNDPSYEGAWFDSLQYRNTFTDDLFTRLPKHVPSRFYGRSVLTRSLKTSNEDAVRNKRKELNKVLERMQASGFDEPPEDIQPKLLDEDAIGFPQFTVPFQSGNFRNNGGLVSESETSFPRRDPDFWSNMYSAEHKKTTSNERKNIKNDNSTQRNVPTSSPEGTQLPCEFCEELFPLDDLLLHQSGCRFSVSSSNRRASPSPTENLRSSPPPVHNSHMDLLPCEFCGVLLEGDLLFHHQDQCEKCPDSEKTSAFTPVLPASDVPCEEEPFRPYEAPTSVQFRHSTTAKVDGAGTDRYLMREITTRPPRPAKTTLLGENRYRQPRVNNLPRDPNLEDTRRRNIEENMRLYKNQRHDHLRTAGASNRNLGSRSKVANTKINPEDVDKEE